MPEFPATRWTEIRAAHGGDGAALRAFVEKYRPPVVAFLRRRGLGDEAEDLAQEVFLRFLNDDVLGRADPTRGRFRSLVLAVTRHVLGHHLERRQTKKRGGDEAIRPMGDLDLAAPATDDDFDREWVGHLLEQALGRLAAEHANYHQALHLFLLEQRTQAEIADAMGCAVSDVKNYVHRGKKKVIQYLQEEVRRYAGTQTEYAEEIEILARILPL